MPLTRPVLSPLWYRALFSAAIVLAFGLAFAEIAVSNSVAEAWQRPLAAAASVALIAAGLAEVWWGLRLRREDPNRRS